jgi:hypothetical protein
MLKTESKARLEREIQYFLQFSDTKICPPPVIIIDKKGSTYEEMELQVEIINGSTLGEVIFIAKESYWDKKRYEAFLCHELGHIIAYQKKIHLPMLNLYKILKNELAADKEGLQLFVRSGRKRWEFFVSLLENFHSLFREMRYKKSTLRTFRLSLIMGNNIIRLLWFFTY